MPPHRTNRHSHKKADFLCGSLQLEFLWNSREFPGNLCCDFNSRIDSRICVLKMVRSELELLPQCRQAVQQVSLIGPLNYKTNQTTCLRSFYYKNFAASVCARRSPQWVSDRDLPAQRSSSERPRVLCLAVSARQQLAF
jgi:hypothetical protein